MTPQGNVGPGQVPGPPPAPGGGGMSETLRREGPAGAGSQGALQAALKAGDPAALQAMKQAQGGAPMPQVPGMSPDGVMAQGGPPSPGGPGGGMVPGAQTERESKLMQLIMKMMDGAKQRGQGGQMMPPQGGPPGGVPPIPQVQTPQTPPPDPTQQAMDTDLQKAMMEASAPEQPPQGSATAPMPGAGESTVNSMRNRGSNMDEAIRAAGG